MRVAILDDIHGAYAATDGVRRLRERAEVTIFERPFGAPAALRGYDALVANRERTKFTPELFASLPDLRIVAQTGNHAYHVDLAAAAGHGVVIAKAAGGFSTGAAELAIGLAIAVVRGIPAADRAVREGRWPTPLGLELADKTMGIVGLGHVGRHVARLANAFGMKVVAWDARSMPRAPRPRASRASTSTRSCGAPTSCRSTRRSRRKRAASSMRAASR
jgi:phosphoglycerate dehydrogenase-like enzyme